MSQITKVMKEWSELEERYQQMMSTDPAAAQTFRQRMTAKFQANIQVNYLMIISECQKCLSVS